MEKVILVVDIETTGLLDKNGKIVEIGIVKLFLETGEIIPAYNSLIKEPEFDISHTKDPFGWIFKNSDLTFEEVMDAPSLESQRGIIQSLFDQYPATAYNKKFDFTFLENRNFRINQLICPMWVADPILKSIGVNKYGLCDKWPSVSECYNYFLGENNYRECVDKINAGEQNNVEFDKSNYKEKHRGLSDAYDVAKIIYELYKMGKYIVYLPEKKKPIHKLSADYINSIETFGPEIYNILLNSDSDEYSVHDFIPFRNGSKWGFCNSHRSIVIDCEYDDLNPFDNEFAKVKINNKYGFIDKSGNVIIKPKYDQSKEFSEGMVAIKAGHKWGYLDSSGNVVIDFIYDEAFDFHEGRAAIVEDEKVGIINASGMKITPAIFERQYKDYSIIGCPLNEKEYRFKDGLMILEGENGYGCINLSGQEVIPFEYKFLSDFNNELALFEKMYGLGTGFIDKSGNIKVNNYSWKKMMHKLESFSEGFAAIKIRFGWGYIDTDLRLAIDPIYFNVNSFREDVALIQEENRNWGVINKNNEMIVSCNYYSINDYHEGLAAFKKDFLSDFGFMNKEGDIKIKPKYAEIKIPFTNGLAKVAIKNRYRYGESLLFGYIDKNGNEYWKD